MPDETRRAGDDVTRSIPTLPDDVTRAAGSSTNKPRTGPADHARGNRIGPYHLLEKLGEGGMGVVYRAEQTEPVRRRVALKLIKPGMDTQEVLARFESERQALALMDHPNVAKVLDAGATEQGRSYFVMEHVAGEPITVYCDRHRLTLPQRLELFIQVCHAVQHAHQKGIIHRDIKPSNVLVMVQDNKAVSKVIDFGVAKAMNQRLTEQTVFTQQGQLIGTPEYMSPEQAEMRALDIDTRTDIYSLGVLLYELLVGALPFDHTALRKAGYAEMQRIIREVEPPRPSAKFSTLGESATPLSERRRLDPKSLARQLRGDLDWIVMKALDKDRTRRYDTANGLGLDLQRYLNHEPVLAGPPSAAYRLKKFVRRNRGAVLAGALTAGALLLGMAGTTGGMFWALHEQAVARTEANNARRAEREQQRERDDAVIARAAETRQRKRAEANETLAQTEAAKFKAVNAFVQNDMLRSVDPENVRGRDITMRAVLDDTAKQLDEGKLAQSPAVEAEVRHTVGVMYRKLAKFEDAERHLRRGIELRKQVVGDRDDADLANDLNSLAVLIDARGRSVEALPMFEEALAMSQRLFPGDHPEVAMGLGNVAFCLRSLGRSAEALPKHEAALAMWQRLFPGDHPEVAAGLNNMADCLQSLGRSAEALPKHEAALAMRQRLFPGNHPEVATGLNGVAVCLQSLGRSAEALPMFEAALALWQRLFPGDHPDVATGLNNLADCLQSLGRSAEALPMFEAALAMRQRLFPGDHPEVAVSLNNMAYCLGSLGRSAEALPKLEAAVAMRRRLFSGDHPDVALGLSNMAGCLKSLGRSAEALSKYEEALAMFKRVLPPDHIDILYSQINLGSMLAKLERFPEAEPLLLDAAAQCERSAAHQRGIFNALIELYDAWHAAEPGQGHDQKAAAWRAKLEEWQASTQPATQPASAMP